MAVVPVNLNLPLYRNADYLEEFFFQESGVPLDFTGYSGRMEVRRYGAEPGNALITSANTTAFAAGVNCSIGGGGVRVWIPWQAIRDLPDGPTRGEPAPFVYDLLLTSPAGIKEVFLTGEANAFPGVTRT